MGNFCRLHMRSRNTSARHRLKPYVYSKHDGLTRVCAVRVWRYIVRITKIVPQRRTICQVVFGTTERADKKHYAPVVRVRPERKSELAHARPPEVCEGVKRETFTDLDDSLRAKTVLHRPRGVKPWKPAIRDVHTGEDRIPPFLPGPFTSLRFEHVQFFIFFHSRFKQNGRNKTIGIFCGKKSLGFRIFIRVIFYVVCSFFLTRDVYF